MNPLLLIAGVWALFVVGALVILRGVKERDDERVFRDRGAR